MTCGRKLGPFDCCSVVQGDCLELMKQLPDGCVDAVITDPPYGIGFKYDCHDDAAEGYGEFISSACSNAERLCREGSPFFVWQAMLNVRHFAEWFPRDFRIFAAAKNFVQMRPTAMQYSFDPVIVWWTEGKPWSAGTSSRDFHVGNTANTLNRKDGNAGKHPCARPLDQVEHIIGQWATPGGLVFDPFLGSGTTAVAALKLGRHFLGFEISEEYCRIARERIALVEAQPSLFDRTEKIRQECLKYDGPDKIGALHGEIDAMVELSMIVETTAEKS